LSRRSLARDGPVLASLFDKNRTASLAMITIDAEPAPVTIDPDRTAVIIIDMQRDFLEPGGFGDSLGNDLSQLTRTIGPMQGAAGRRPPPPAAGHPHARGSPARPVDAPQAKIERGAPSMRIGDSRTDGTHPGARRAGHDIVRELYPQPQEPVIDKPGKGAFYATDLHTILIKRDIDALIVCGVTTEVCVHTTVREANDRGYRCIVPADCCGSYFPEFHEVGLRMIAAQGGIFGWVSDAPRILDALGETQAIRRTA
jgi:nicotinamidase-related amidase